jgi:hypothetical protein
MTEAEQQQQEGLPLGEQIALFQGLMAHPAWRILTQAIQAQVDTLQQNILFGSVGSAEDLYKMERMKGSLEGRLSLVGTAMGIIDTLEQDKRQASANLEG